MAKILVIDDSDTLRFQLRKDLEEAGHAVVEAVDGADGLDKIRKNNDVQLIMCDLNMPNMDGLTMCSKLQGIEGAQNVPIFMLTTEASPELKARAKEYKVRAWITKPYSIDKLLAAIGKVINS